MHKTESTIAFMTILPLLVGMRKLGNSSTVSKSEAWTLLLDGVVKPWLHWEEVPLPEQSLSPYKLESTRWADIRIDLPFCKRSTAVLTVCSN
jgi:hypothetical protein